MSNISFIISIDIAPPPPSIIHTHWIVGWLVYITEGKIVHENPFCISIDLYESNVFQKTTNSEWKDKYVDRIGSL